MNEMEKFKPHGRYQLNNWGGLEIELSPCGSMARVRKNYGQEKLLNGKWQEVKYTLKGRAYINHYKTRYHLDHFMRY